MNVANTSDSECTASDTMAPDLPMTPANSLNPASRMFPKMPTRDIFLTILASSISLPQAAPHFRRAFRGENKSTSREFFLSRRCAVRFCCHFHDPATRGPLPAPRCLFSLYW